MSYLQWGSLWMDLQAASHSVAYVFAFHLVMWARVVVMSESLPDGLVIFPWLSELCH